MNGLRAWRICLMIIASVYIWMISPDSVQGSVASSSSTSTMSKADLQAASSSLPTLSALMSYSPSFSPNALTSILTSTTFLESLAMQSMSTTLSTAIITSTVTFVGYTPSYSNPTPMTSTGDAQGYPIPTPEEKNDFSVLAPSANVTTSATPQSSVLSLLASTSAAPSPSSLTLLNQAMAGDAEAAHALGMKPIPYQLGGMFPFVYVAMEQDVLRIIYEALMDLAAFIEKGIKAVESAEKVVASAIDTGIQKLWEQYHKTEDQISEIQAENIENINKAQRDLDTLKGGMKALQDAIDACTGQSTGSVSPSTAVQKSTISTTSLQAAGVPSSAIQTALSNKSTTSLSAIQQAKLSAHLDVFATKIAATGWSEAQLKPAMQAYISTHSVSPTYATALMQTLSTKQTEFQTTYGEMVATLQDVAHQIKSQRKTSTSIPVSSTALLQGITSTTQPRLTPKRMTLPPVKTEQITPAVVAGETAPALIQGATPQAVSTLLHEAAGTISTATTKPIPAPTPTMTSTSTVKPASKKSRAPVRSKPKAIVK